MTLKIEVLCGGMLEATEQLSFSCKLGGQWLKLSDS